MTSKAFTWSCRYLLVPSANATQEKRPHSSGWWAGECQTSFLPVAVRKGGLEAMEELLVGPKGCTTRCFQALASHLLREAPEIAKPQADAFAELAEVLESWIAIQNSKSYLKALQALERTVVLERVPGHWVSAFKKVRSTDVSRKPLLDQDFEFSFISYFLFWKIDSNNISLLYFLFQPKWRSSVSMDQLRSHPTWLIVTHSALNKSLPRWMCSISD